MTHGPGRPHKTELDRLKTRTWYASIRGAASAGIGREATDKNLMDVFRETLSEDRSLANDPKHWGRYRLGKRTPGPETLDVVERVYSGTRRVFEHGPGFSYLWEALCGDPREAITLTEDEWRNGVPVEHVVVIQGKEGVQDLVVPKELAARWGLTPGLRLDLAEKLKPWEHLDDLCGQVSPQGGLLEYTAAVLLTYAPSATSTREEREKVYPRIKMPYVAGLAYRIAQVRVAGGKEVVLPLWECPTVSFDAEQTPEEREATFRKTAEEYYSREWADYERVSGLTFRFSMGVSVNLRQQ